MKRYKRKPTEMTADRLKDHTERYYDLMDGRERDDFSHVIQVLEEIADGTRSTEGERA